MLCSYNVAFEWGDGGGARRAQRRRLGGGETHSQPGLRRNQEGAQPPHSPAPLTAPAHTQGKRHSPPFTHRAQAMSSFSLPASAVPAWAQAVPERVWVAAVKEAAVTGKDLRGVIQSMTAYAQVEHKAVNVY